ncbi:MAG TPA: DUF6179 domain-containing protein [Mobilitalea sp.]|nr:DUF6179 domain-containing protein [Mobilitalea sp.]
MEQIQNKNIPDESRLIQGNYFQSLLMETYRMNLINETRLMDLQLELAELIGVQSERYTYGESSSIKIEAAQNIIQSICYCIGAYLKSAPTMEQRIEFLQTEKIRTLFYKGMDVVSAIRTEAKEMLEGLQKESLDIDNIAYNDTLFKGLPAFFHDYEIEFAAHEDCGSIDYPLCDDITGVTGVEYIVKYIRRLQEENNFCNKFSKESISRLLQGYLLESKHMLINIYELVLVNAIGGEMSGDDIYGLTIDSANIEYLQKKLEDYTAIELKERLIKAYEDLCDIINYKESITNYTKDCIANISVRIKNNLETKTLGKIFIDA